MTRTMETDGITLCHPKAKTFYSHCLIRSFTIDYGNKLINKTLAWIVHGRLLWSSIMVDWLRRRHLWRIAITEAAELPSQFDRLYQESWMSEEVRIIN